MFNDGKENKTIYGEDYGVDHKNYPLWIGMNEEKDLFLPHRKTEFVIACRNKRWKLSSQQLLDILERQNIVMPFGIIPEEEFVYCKG